MTPPSGVPDWKYESHQSSNRPNIHAICGTDFEMDENTDKEILASDSWEIYLRHKFHLFEWKSVRLFWYHNLILISSLAYN